jgi:hypothetical protein
MSTMSNKRQNWILIITLISLLSSCARIVYEPVPKDSDDDSNGIRFYHSSPYVLVYSNGKGGLITQILYIADPYKKISAKPKSFMATAQTTMEFDKGVYKSAKNTIDATAVPSAIIKAVEAAAPAFIAALNEPVPTLKVPPPYLYKIIVDGSSVKFVGGQGDISINVNVLKQKEESK